MIASEVGSYRLVSVLGYGGMGAVYLATRSDGSYQQRVAIKIIRGGLLDPELVRRFRHERQFLAALSHPSIARLLDGGTTGDSLPYLVMEFIDGTPIDEYCDSHRLDIDQRLELFLQVCSAVQFAHTNLIVHRDLKPDNVLVTEDGTAKLLDFGIAKLTRPDIGHTFDPITATTRIMTPRYASPEQIRGEPITTGTDVYSLGVILYELLSGRLPYELSDLGPREVWQVVCEHEPARPSSLFTGSATRADVASGEASLNRNERPERLRRRLSGDLDNIVLVALRKEPERRYASVEQMADDLRRHLAGLPVRAHKDSLRYRAVKFARRHRLLVSAAVIVALLGAAVVAQSLRVTRTGEVARREAAKATAVSGFLMQALQASNVLEGGDHDETVVEMLERAAAAVGESFADQPEVEAAARDAIGDSFVALGRYQEAAEQYRTALELRRRVLGDGHVDLAISLNGLGTALMRLGRLQDAKQRFEEALELRRLRLKPPDPRIADSLSNLGNALGALGEYSGAREVHRQALAMSRRLDRQSAMVSALTNLAIDSRLVGEPDEAAELLREALSLERELRGGETPRVAVILVNLSNALLDAGEPREGERHLREALTIQRETMGPEHPHTIASLHNLAGIQLALRNLDEA